MKKLLLSLVACLVAIAANAQDYTSWYVNVPGVYNNWADNGVQPTDNNNPITTTRSLAIGTSEFKIKVWPGGGEDIYYSTGNAIPQDTWVKIEGNADANMTIAGATSGERFDVQWNCKTNEIKVTKSTGEMVYYLTGDFNSWSPGDINYKFTKQEDGSYLSPVVSSLKEFLITDGTWANKWGTSGSDVTLDTPYTTSVGGDNLTFGGNTISNAVVKFNPENLTIVVTGNNEGGGGGGTTPSKPEVMPSTVYMIGNVDGCGWATNKGVPATGNAGVYTWTGVTIDGGEGTGYFAFATVISSMENDWDMVNSGDRFGAPAENTPIAVGETKDVTYYQVNVNASSSQSWALANGTYNITLNLNEMKVTVAANNGEKPENPPVTPPTGDKPEVMPATAYIIGNVDPYSWAEPIQGVAATGNNGVYNWTGVTITDAGAGLGYFTFVTVVGGYWDDPYNDNPAVNSGDRFGAPAKDTPVAAGQSVDVTYYIPEVDASAAQSWAIVPGVYNMTLNLNEMKLSVANGSTLVVDAVEAEGEAVYFDLQGRKVLNPEKGQVVIRVQGEKVVKEIK